MKASVFLLLVLVAYSNSYKIVSNYSGPNFFDGWSFYSSADPTHGTVNYVTQDVAQRKGYTKIIDNTQVFIGCDNIVHR